MDNSLDEFYIKYHFNLIILFGVIVALYIGVFSVFNNFSFNTPQTRPWVMLIEIIMWGMFVLIIYLNIKHFSVFDYDFNNILFSLFGTKHKDMEIRVNKKYDASCNLTRAPTPRPKVKQDCSSNDILGEVFHIPHNTYGYDEAADVCKLFDSRLASYDEVEQAYKQGANWCSYGWSSDQLALFPIQKSMYNELKKIPGHEHDCGRPGVNGGYMENADMKFGVNCYGKKPYAGEDDLEYMKKYSFSNAYADEELKAKEKKSEKMKKILVAPFNKEKWNES